MVSHSLNPPATMSNVVPEGARLAVRGPHDFGGLTPRVRLSDLGLRTLVLATVSFCPMFALGAESAGGIGFLFSAVLVLGGPALGGVVVYVILNVPRAITRWRWTTAAMAYWRWSRVPKNFARAEIASILVPLVDHAGLEEGTIQIVGSDGGYLAGPKEEKLTAAIKKWTKEGHKVRYILVSPSDEAALKLEELGSALGDRLEVLVLDSASTKSLPKKARRVKRVLTTCHPTLIWSNNDDHKAMWIEGNHPFGENVSYNNQWVPPAAMGKSVPDWPNRTWEDVFSTWRSQLDVLCEHIPSRQLAQ